MSSTISPYLCRRQTSVPRVSLSEARERLVIFRRGKRRIPRPSGAGEGLLSPSSPTVKSIPSVRLLIRLLWTNRCTYFFLPKCKRVPRRSCDRHKPSDSRTRKTRERIASYRPASELIARITISQNLTHRLPDGDYLPGNCTNTTDA